MSLVLLTGVPGSHLRSASALYHQYQIEQPAGQAAKSTLSVKKAAEITHNMYQITYTLPESKYTKSILLKMDDQQAELFRIIQENC
jgi:hypothetical protein